MASSRRDLPAEQSMLHCIKVYTYAKPHRYHKSATTSLTKIRYGLVFYIHIWPQAKSCQRYAIMIPRTAFIQFVPIFGDIIRW